MAACPRRRGQAFFDGANPVLFCRNALWYMAAPSISRRSRQRQGVVSYKGIKSGGLDFYLKPSWDRYGMEKGLLYDGFFFCRRPADF